MVRSTQLGDSRATPTVTPSSVASTMPSRLTRSVLTMPTSNARPKLSVGWYGMPLSGIAKPAVWRKNSQPSGIFERLSPPSSVRTSSVRASTISTTNAICASADNTLTLR